MSIKLIHQGKTVATLNVAAILGKNSFQGNPTESQFLSREQFRIIRDNDQWLLEHLPSAVNSTICNGVSVSAPMTLRSGMIISVGNVARHIEKFRLEVQIDEETKRVLPPSPSVEMEIENPADSIYPDEADVSDVEDLAPHRPSPKPIDSKSAAAASVDTPSRGDSFLSTLLDIGIAMATSGGSSGGCTKVYQGSSRFNPVILTIDGDKVHLGSSAFNEVVLLISGDKIIRGSSMFGDVIAHRDGNRVIAGSSYFGDTIAVIDNEKVIEGTSTFFGDVIAIVENGGMMSATAAAAYLLLM